MSQPSETTQRLTRKQCRRRQSPIPVEFNHDTSDTVTLDSVDTSYTIVTSQMSSPVRLLVCSIGNPGSYLNTLHSAGHSVLSALASSLSYPPFQKSRSFGNGLVSAGSEFTLWQSTSLMNVSGAGVAAAWRQFQKESRGEPMRLVVVHDELEIGLGQVKVKSGTASAKGHNGLKSINGLLNGNDYTRIAVGIGRPESRDPDTVARYVLIKMSGVQKSKVEGSTTKVLEELRRLSEG